MFSSFYFCTDAAASDAAASDAAASDSGATTSDAAASDSGATTSDATGATTSDTDASATGATDSGADTFDGVFISDTCGFGCENNFISIPSSSGTLYRVKQDFISCIEGLSLKIPISFSLGTYLSNNPNLRTLKNINKKTIIAIVPPGVSNISNEVDTIIQDIIYDINGVLYLKVSGNIFKILYGLVTSFSVSVFDGKDKIKYRILTILYMEKNSANGHIHIYIIKEPIARDLHTQINQ